MTVHTIGTNSRTVFDAGVPAIAYEHAQNPDEAHRLIRQARLQGPIALGPHGPEVLSYELVRTVLRDPRFCMPKGLVLAAQGITSGRLWDKATTGLLSLDGAEHHRLRRLVCKAFTARSTARLQTTIVNVITELVDPVTITGRCDVVADITRRYPIPIICELLGAPRRDWQLFSDWADDIFKIFNWNVANDAAVIMAAFDELDAYIDDMIAQRRRNLTDDLISQLIRAEDDGDRLSADELVMLVEVLLMAGTDTTRNQLAAAVDELCDHPQQWALLAQHPELAPQAVEELMRHSPVIFAAMRMAAEDVQLGGSPFPPAHSCLPTLPPPTATPPSTTTPTALTSPAQIRQPCSASAAAFTTAWERTWPDSNSPKPLPSSRAACPTRTAAAPRPGSHYSGSPDRQLCPSNSTPDAEPADQPRAG
jgi:cytochrome P450